MSGSVRGAKEQSFVPTRQGDFRLIDFDHAFEGLSIWIDHGAPELLRQ
jgi:hypothetical protein